MNSEVTVSGMNLTASTPTNILVSSTENGAYSNSATADETFGTAKIFPASSNDGKVFNAIQPTNNLNNGLGGDAVDGTTFQLTSDQTSTTVTKLANDADGYWVEYDYWLKLGQAQDTDVNVYLSQLHIKDTADAIKYVKAAGTTYTKISDAAGIADEDVDTQVFSDAQCQNKFASVDAFNNATTYYVKPLLATSARVAIYYTEPAGSQTKLDIYGIKDSDASVNAVTAKVTEAGKKLSELGQNPTTDTAAKLADVDGKYDKAEAETFTLKKDGSATKVEVFIWVEGQESHCINANAGATFEVDLAFAIKEA